MTMGILDEIFDVPTSDEEKILIEAPGDEDTPGGDDAPATDDAGNDAEEAPADDADNAAEDQTDDQNAEEDQGNENQDDNFDIDTNADDDAGEGEDQPDADQTAANATGGPDADSEEDETSQEAKSKKELYDQMYKDLTPEERAYRDMILKDQYKELHRMCGSIVMKTGYFPNIAESQPLLKRLIQSLNNFRKYIGFYLTDVYPTKSFYENKYQYEVYLQIFNGIKSIYSDLEAMLSHEDK